MEAGRYPLGNRALPSFKTQYSWEYVQEWLGGITHGKTTNSLVKKKNQRQVQQTRYTWGNTDKVTWGESSVSLIYKRTVKPIRAGTTGTIWCQNKENRKVTEKEEEETLKRESVAWSATGMGFQWNTHLLPCSFCLPVCAWMCACGSVCCDRCCTTLLPSRGWA